MKYINIRNNWKEFNLPETKILSNYSFPYVSFVNKDILIIYGKNGYNIPRIKINSLYDYITKDLYIIIG